MASGGWEPGTVPTEVDRGCPMNRTAPSRTVSRVVQRIEQGDSASLIESLTLEATDRLVALLVRNGVAPAAIEKAVRSAGKKHSSDRRTAPPDSLTEQYEASLLLAVWHTDLEYLDPEGRPIRLPLEGAAPSLEALIERVGLESSAQEMARYLERIKAIRAVGQTYVPLRGARSLLGTGSLAHREALRLVVRLLRSLDDNRAERRAGHLDRIKLVTALESTEVPVRLRSVCRAQVTRDIQQYLRELESRMLRYERNRVSGEPLLHTGIGVFHFEEALSEDEPRARKPKRAGRQGRAPRRRRTE